jgi:antitoxin (DNA-binding transcriptional repressor) of toxin-antitoxin stability system
MQWITAEEFRKRQGNILEGLAPGHGFVIIRDGRPVAKLIGVREQPGPSRDRAHVMPPTTEAGTAMTIDEFLLEPYRHIGALGSENIPAEWIRAAWADVEFRDEAVYNLCRSVSKIGTLNTASDWLNVLSGALPVDQVVDLYRSIRDGTERCESEWRAQFEGAFPEAMPRLPPIDRGRELRNHTLYLFWMIYSGETERVRQATSDLLEAGFTVEEAVVSSRQFAELPDGDECLMEIRKLRGGPPPDVISALELPGLLGKEHLLKHIKRVAQTKAGLDRREIEG